MARRKKLPLIKNLEIIDIADEGKAIGKTDNMVVFVKGLVPGDIADIQIKKKRKKYLEGIVIRLVKQSDLRITPFCRHFGICGGCKWQNLTYEKQLYFKQKQVADNIQRIGQLEMPELYPILGSDKQQYYRNKLEYTFSNIRWLENDEIHSGCEFKDRKALGFHIPGRFDRILHIDTCYLQNDLSNKIRNEISVYTKRENYSYYDQTKFEGLMRNLIIRNTELNEWMVIVVFQKNESSRIEKLLKHIDSEFPEITSLMYVINSKVNDTIHDLDVHLFSGRDHIYEQMGDLKFKIGPKSFFQTNTMQAYKLYEIVKKFAELKGNEIVYDLYTGTGTIANFIASECKRVIGLEYVEDAIQDAITNSECNNIRNTTFFAGDIKDLLTEKFVKKHGTPDIMITDPPRAGMHSDVLHSILKLQPYRIVYISCNPATQARDIHILRNKYKLKAIQPVDMFPHTHHVENVVQLGLK
ncbi:MAG: 23S rRNA (uracil(1939)-C(5))-methyltransferase RlmD [Bacteroidales bacterium]|nr:23S rRNA (uracil(1939)-C(5))-methyltransferase RlmD [Bacteroidales bacterium]